MIMIRALLAALALLVFGQAAQAQSVRLSPRQLVGSWSSLPPETLEMPSVPAWTTNCAEPLPAGNMQIATNMPGAWKFTVNQGDIPPGDEGRVPARSRCEFSGSSMKQAYGTDYWQAMSQWISCFTVTSGRQLYFGQWHASDDGGDVSPSHPIWAIRQDTATRLRITYSGSIDDNTTIVDSTAFTDNSFQCGVWYDWVFQSNFSKSAAGTLNVWRRKAGATSFTQVAALTNINMGYNDVAGPYWKWGYYGYNDPASVTVIYANQTFPTTSSLAYLLTCASCWAKPVGSIN